MEFPQFYKGFKIFPNEMSTLPSITWHVLYFKPSLMDKNIFDHFINNGFKGNNYDLYITSNGRGNIFKTIRNTIDSIKDIGYIYDRQAKIWLQYSNKGTGNMDHLENMKSKIKNKINKYQRVINKNESKYGQFTLLNGRPSIITKKWIHDKHEYFKADDELSKLFWKLNDLNNAKKVFSCDIQTDGSNSLEYVIPLNKHNSKILGKGFIKGITYQGTIIYIQISKINSLELIEDGAKVGK